MISKETIDRIFQTARVDEVVGDFVTLRKRGVNLLGLCPFHNEKTPSFTVSPVKGIYKCFGCGKAGNAVNFIMEHEHATYPEALRYLAKKYNIEIEEEFSSQETPEAVNEKESLYIVNAFAQKYFSNTLHNHPDGIAIGMSYFKERGFSEETCAKFQLGYSPDAWSAFTDEALKNGYHPEFLEKAGLTITGEGKRYDRFRGRVMFPIHNLAGRVIGFGGRILKSDAKAAKYINSPESEIYHKSNVLYGIFFAKKAIVEKDNCYLVEGYTDVISLHQAGVENVAASSGTSLTPGQVKLIGRYTKNVTVLYDGDAAGIKASLRGINLILEEGLNVKVVLFPDGDDPDSYAQKAGPAALREFITSNAKDFISFKTNLLLKDAEGDPIRKAGLVRDIVESIAVIPDAIIRSAFVKECSILLDMHEQMLITEINKIRREAARKRREQSIREQQPVAETDYVIDETAPIIQPDMLSDDNSEFQEREIIRILLSYANQEIQFTDYTIPKEPVITKVKTATFILDRLQDVVMFDNAWYAVVYEEFRKKRTDEDYPEASFFIHHPDVEISRLCIDLLADLYDLSPRWETHDIFVTKEENNINNAAISAIRSLQLVKAGRVRKEMRSRMKTASAEEQSTLLQMIKEFDEQVNKIAREKGIVIKK